MNKNQPPSFIELKLLRLLQNFKQNFVYFESIFCLYVMIQNIEIILVTCTFNFFVWVHFLIPSLKLFLCSTLNLKKEAWFRLDHPHHYLFLSVAINQKYCFVFVNNIWVIDKKMGQEIPSIPRNSGYVIKEKQLPSRYW